jgi:25S rRNA (adenine(2142)-N(1))-methyltransferase, Bmt2
MDQERHREAWDIISLSLVLNFVPDGKDRGTLLLPLVTSGLQWPTDSSLMVNDDDNVHIRADARTGAFNDSSGRSMLSCCASYRAANSFPLLTAKKIHHSSLFLVSIIHAI